MRNINEHKSNIYENNPYAKFIRSFLAKIKGDDKKNILIIDDLDRIDPEHIFRLFNVFSAQKNYNTKVDKFGFDKVIFVCDISNIMKIYEHKYGVGVDFWGYISKFVSDRVFHFDNKDLIGEKLHNVLRNISYNHSLAPHLILSNDRDEARQNKSLLVFLLKMLMYFDYLSLRDIVKMKTLNIPIDRTNEFFKTLIIYIDAILGSEGKFKNIINHLSKKGEVYNYKSINSSSVEDIIYDYKNLFGLIYYDDNLKNSQQGTEVTFNISNDLEITLITNGYSDYKIVLKKGNIKTFNILEYLNNYL